MCDFTETTAINPGRKNPYSDDFKQLEKFAKDNGLVMIPRMSNQVQVDIDSPFLPVDFNQRLSMIHEVSPIIIAWRNPSRNGNIHVTVDFLHDLNPNDALLYEAILGSDFKRVALGKKGLAKNAGERYVSVFFEKPGYQGEYMRDWYQHNSGDSK